MGQYKTQRSKKGRASSRQMPWLALGVVGVMIVIGALAILLGRNRDGESGSGSTEFDSDFAPAVTGAPRVDVAQDFIDYGDVPLGETITTTFEVRNVGDEPLVILGEPQVELDRGVLTASRCRQFDDHRARLSSHCVG